LAPEPEVPRTLFLVGATSALAVIGADAICCAFTTTTALATGWPPVKAVCGTAVTPPRAVLFTYVMFVLLMLFVT
jgi:hypothetical protein